MMWLSVSQAKGKKEKKKSDGRLVAKWSWICEKKGEMTWKKNKETQWNQYNWQHVSREHLDYDSQKGSSRGTYTSSFLAGNWNQYEHKSSTRSRHKFCQSSRINEEEWTKQMASSMMWCQPMMWCKVHFVILSKHDTLCTMYRITYQTDDILFHCWVMMDWFDIQWKMLRQRDLEQFDRPKNGPLRFTVLLSI